MAAVPEAAPVRCSSCATSMPATGRSARSSASSLALCPGRAGAARLERRGQDHDRPSVLRSHRADSRPRAVRRHRRDLLAALSVRTLGIVHAPEGRSVFASLTVEENLELTFRRSRGRSGVRDALDEAYSCSALWGTAQRQLAGTLSGGEQRMLSLARVLVEQPRAADRRRAVARAGADRHRRGVPDARDDSRRGHDVADRRAARAPRARDRRRRDRDDEGRGRLTRRDRCPDGGSSGDLHTRVLGGRTAAEPPTAVQTC